MIEDYLLKFYIEDCLRVLNNKDDLGHFSIKIDFLKLFEAYPDVGEQVLCKPVETILICDKDILKVQQIILESNDFKDLVSKLTFCTLKKNVHARFFGLPVCPELRRNTFPKNADLGCFLQVTGTVVRVTQSKMLEYQRKYVCMKCKFENYVEADFESRYVLKAPSKCSNQAVRCKFATFSQENLISREYCKDYQEIKIQEQVNKLNIGTIPGSMWIVLEDDLVDTCKPGDDVNICGTVRRRWRPNAQNKKSEVELVLQANYIEVCNAQRSRVLASAPDVQECFDDYWNKFAFCPLKGRDQILASVCPQVYGLHVVKLALLLTVITGSDHVFDSESEKGNIQEEKHTSRVRGQCHLLLVGDPGTGKSQLLSAGARLTPRAVFTSGAGSSRAGLTCSALREEGEWQLEAGALVLSDGGVCCIDEISQLRDHDRTAIHEAMEQQTISIAKAGIVCKLNTRCAVIAACNPKGHYDREQPLSVNVSLGTPLLSRFDLIFILLDAKNREWDQLVSSYILFGGDNSADTKKIWNVEKLQIYIGLVGPKKTKMSKSANVILQSYYMAQRMSQLRDPSRTTVRMLDSLYRLSQAHCRLMYRNIIMPVDAITAVSLVDLSMQDCTLEDTVDALHSTFNKYPDFEYLRTAKKLLSKLNLHEIWQEELLCYSKLLQVDHKTLGSDIEKNNSQLFARYNDISDDNIPLSAAIVTSTYFKNKTEQRSDLATPEKNLKSEREESVVGERLAAKLKKHPVSKKADKKPSVPKRKSVTVSSDRFLNKNNKKVKLQTKEIMKNIDEDSEDDTTDNKLLLNVVPSVNDIFYDIDIDPKVKDNEHRENIHMGDSTKKEYFKSKNNKGVMCDKNIKTNDSIIEKSNSFESSKIENDKINNVKCSKEQKDASPTSNTVSKLKQFQFTPKHDLDKFYTEQVEKPFNKSNEEIIQCRETQGTNQNITESKSAVASRSQISIFESSNIDEIDLDI